MVYVIPTTSPERALMKIAAPLFRLTLALLLFAITNNTTAESDSPQTSSDTLVPEEQLNNAIKAAEESTQLEKASREKLIGLYKSTIEQQKKVLFRNEATTAFIHSGELAPEKLKAIIEEIQQQQDDIDVTTLPPLPDESLAERVALELSRVVQREIQDARDQLLARLERSPGDPALLNRLGVLYARFGLDGDAEEQFRKAIDVNQHAPATMNLATIYLARGEIETALELYRDVNQQDPNNAMAVLGITRAYHSMAFFSNAREWHARLVRLAPELARDFEFLSSSSGTASRAGQSATVEGEFVWAE